MDWAAWAMYSADDYTAATRQPFYGSAPPLHHAGEPQKQPFLLRDILKLVGETIAVIEGLRMLILTVMQWARQVSGITDRNSILRRCWKWTKRILGFDSGKPTKMLSRYWREVVAPPTASLVPVSGAMTLSSPHDLGEGGWWNRMVVYGYLCVGGYLVYLLYTQWKLYRYLAGKLRKSLSSCRSVGVGNQRWSDSGKEKAWVSFPLEKLRERPKDRYTPSRTNQRDTLYSITEEDDLPSSNPCTTTVSSREEGNRRKGDGYDVEECKGKYTSTEQTYRTEEIYSSYMSSVCPTPRRTIYGGKRNKNDDAIVSKSGGIYADDCRCPSVFPAFSPEIVPGHPAAVSSRNRFDPPSVFVPDSLPPISAAMQPELVRFKKLFALHHRSVGIQGEPRGRQVSAGENHPLT